MNILLWKLNVFFLSADSTAVTTYPPPPFLLQVVVKTRTEYQTEKKRLKVPKVEEFTISFTDGVSERLKVSARRPR